MIEPLIAQGMLLTAKSDWALSSANGFYFGEIREGRVDVSRHSVVRDGHIEFSVVKARHSDTENTMAWYYVNGAQSVPFEKAWDVLITRYPDVAEYFLFNPEKIR